MSLKNRCGGCKYYRAYNMKGLIEHYCVGVYSGRTVKTEKKTAACSHYKPLGTEPARVMCYADFVDQCKGYYHRYLAPLGYCACECQDLTPKYIDGATPFYHAEFYRPTKVDGKDAQRVELMIDFCPSENNYHKAAMLYENFDCLEQIPEQYGDLRHGEMNEQPPQFVYGYFSRLGDALNSTLKGNSLNLRKPIELYY